MQLPTPVSTNYMLITLLILVIGSPIVYAIGRKSGKVSAYLATILAFAATVIFIIPIGASVALGYPVYEYYPWNTGLLELDFGLYADGLSTPIAAITLALSAFATMYSIGYLKKETNLGAYFALMLLYITGMVGVILSTNLLEFFVFWEVMLIPSWAMIMRWGTPGRAVRAGFKYFMYTQFGSICILIAIALTWWLSGETGTPTLNIYELGIPVSVLAQLSVALYMIGFAIKMAIFPLHTWLPDAHAEAPTPISAILSGVMIETAAYAIIRIPVQIYGTTFTNVTVLTLGSVSLTIGNIIAVFAVVTMIYGGLMALAQTDTKRLFAYSSISQMGYILFGIAALTSIGLTGASLHIVTHAFGKGALFMVAGVLMTQVGHSRGRDITQLGGLAQKMPITATITLIAGLSIAGTPPLAGFASEWLIFAGSNLANQYLLTVFAVCTTALTAGYILWFIRRVFFGPVKEGLEDVKEAPLSMLIPMALLAFGAVLIGIFPNIIINYLLPIIQNIAPLL
ncbi:MAG: complex I subunit 4 family protein [Candidatus Odinarchaeia archaeon]